MKYYEEVEVDDLSKIMDVLKGRGYTPPDTEHPFLSESVWHLNGEPRTIVKIKSYLKRPGMYFVWFSDEPYTPKKRIYKRSLINRKDVLKEVEIRNVK